MTQCIHDETLSRYSVGDCSAEEARTIEAHLDACGSCRARLDQLRLADAALREAVTVPVPADAAASAWRAIADELESRPPPEIMTIDEVARFLRIPAGDLEPFLEDLPCFEFAGRVRIRRSRLLDWIADRERRYRSGASAYGQQPFEIRAAAFDDA